MTRTATEEDELAARPVRAGKKVIMPIFALHRQETLWEAPDVFDPGRFEPEQTEGRHRFAYLPFSSGQKVCLGTAFALMEAQIILATLLARFEVSLPEGFVPEPRMWFTIRPGTGMPLIFRPRHGS
jgi:Cytochrome P450